MMLSTTYSYSQNNSTLTGKVKDTNGEAITGAYIKVKGGKAVGITDYDGNFSLTGVKAGDKLEITYVGMKPQVVSAKMGMNVILEEESAALNEVMVTAFGEQKRSAFTGSAAVIDSKKLEKKQLTNVLSGLQGEAAGVQMVNNSGDPTATPEIRIRGFSSISAGKDPLIIVDGSPYDGGWNNINPADVASVTVLKDAASAALYGARGANGIIMVTTKKAQSGDATITVDTKWGGTTRIKRDYETINDVGQYYETYYKALYNYAVNSQNMSNYEAHAWANSTLGTPTNEGGLGYMAMSVPTGEYLIGDNGRLNPNATHGNHTTGGNSTYTIMPDNWLDEASRTGLRQEYNININGGNGKAQFYGSLGYLNTQGICNKSDFERYSARLKANYQAKDWFRVGGNVSFTHANSNYTTGSGNNLFYFAQQIAPIYPVYIRDANGSIMTDKNGKVYDYGDAAIIDNDRPYQPKYNPLQDAELNTYDGHENQFTINGFADVTPIEGLKITLNGTATVQNRKFSSTSNPFYGYSANTYPNGYVYQGKDETYSYNFQQLINYKKDFGLHHMELLLGHENYRMNYDYLWGSRRDMVSYFDNQTLAGAITIDDNNSQRQDYNTEGYFFRGQYDYSEKYFGSVSVRRDASSRFHPDHRWGTFFSFGGAWIMTKEEWLSKTDWLNTLKLKASFGQVGNDNIGDFLYMNTYKIVNSDGNVGLITNTIGNENITWETLNNFNIGVEFELFKSRLRGNIEYFNKKTTDMLCFVAAPKSAGYSGTYDNIGDMLNTGVEVELSGDVIKTRDFTWTIGANATLYKNRITKIAEQLATKNLEDHPGYSSGSYYYGEGLPLYTWYMPKYAGLTEDGRSQWYVNNNDGTLGTTTNYSDADYYVCDDPNPWMYGGFSTSLSYKGFDLSVSFTYSLGGKAYDNGYSYVMTNPVQSNTGYAIHKDVLNAWSADNQTSNIPRWQYNDQNTSAFSDRFLTDASSLSLSNINLGYTFNKALISKWKLSNLRIYVTAENVYYWTKRKGFDPRGSFSGEASTSTYSPSRTISGGLTVSF